MNRSVRSETFAVIEDGWEMGLFRGGICHHRYGVIIRAIGSIAEIIWICLLSVAANFQYAGPLVVIIEATDFDQVSAACFYVNYNLGLLSAGIVIAGEQSVLLRGTFRASIDRQYGIEAAAARADSSLAGT